MWAVTIHCKLGKVVPAVAGRRWQGALSKELPTRVTRKESIGAQRTLVPGFLSSSWEGSSVP